MAVSMVMVLGVAMVPTAVLQGQAIHDIVANPDKRTLRERADEALRKGAPDSVVISMYEQWLHAVPSDTSAAKQLAALYTKVGRTADASAATRLSSPESPSADPRLETVYTLQVRLGMYKVYGPAKPKPGIKYPAVLVLHGNGHNEEVMLNWVKSLNMDSVYFILPQAPYAKLSDIMASHRPRYSATDVAPTLPDSLLPQVVDASAAWYHDAYIDASVRYPISAIKPIVIGFSQGGFYSYAVATRYPHTFQSVVSVCASMYAYGGIRERLPDLRAHGIDVLVLHGSKDDVVPLQVGELISSLLHGSNVQHTFHVFEGGHWPSAPATAMIRNWLITRLH